MTGSATVHPFISAEGWQAIGSIATAVAVIVAIVQLRDARRTVQAQMKLERDTAADQLRQAQEIAVDQARPYVLLTAEPSDTDMGMWDLILQNVGAGPARDVTIQVDPPFLRAEEHAGLELANARMFGRPIPMIPPRFRSVAFFDAQFERFDRSDLPNEHTVTIGYHDGRGHAWTETSVIDLTILDGMLVGDRFSVHHAAKALQEIQEVLKGSTTLKGGPLDVVVESPAGRRARLDENARHREEMIAKAEARQAAAVDAAPSDGPTT